MSLSHLPPLPLPQGIDEHYVQCTASGLNVHYLDSGYTPEHTKPLLLLVHGFPELAFSWRKIMSALADDGYYVVAFDQRGYGRTTGWDDSDMMQFSITTLVRDAVVFVNALGYREVACIVGHDFGAVTAAMCALMRPDMFKSVVLMSHPFTSMPSVPFNIARAEPQPPETPVDIQKELVALQVPRKHYKYYSATPAAARHWDRPAQGMPDFLRGYIHVKSANWAPNKPYPLKEWSASELAKLPHYYVLPLDKSMPETIAAMMEAEGSPEGIEKTKRWMSDDDLAVYVGEWTRSGFQGGLNWYRTMTDPSLKADLALFANKKIECPSVFISGAQDWGNYQEPGALERMPDVCVRYKGVRLVEGAGHWPQQEQPERVAGEILGFLEGSTGQ